MSVLINMEMPKPKLADMATIYGAYILVSPNGHAAILVDNEDGLEYTEYSLTHVPPHGDLIDRDALAKNVTGAIYHSELRAAPTIIPAEEGE